MPPHDVLDALRRRPFAPFRLHVTDGTVYEIRHPEMLLVGLASFTVAIPAQPDSPVYSRTEVVAARQVVRLVPLEQSATQQGNGHQTGSA